ncbi:unnamed protein product [Miscanthus lutarioriparius]|uniref:Uncharacterized protein n=1 Tax=Miscanthus lutarioriparius TaxID=422564 RepID=A0A811N3A8_9POAL|nr:unnamed protein product [Miscanthus lutarioriparius]
MSQTLQNHLKRYPILSKLLWLALGSFGHATAWLSHQQDYFSDEKEATTSLEG